MSIWFVHYGEMVAIDQFMLLQGEQCTEIFSNKLAALSTSGWPQHTEIASSSSASLYMITSASPLEYYTDMILGVEAILNAHLN